MLAVTAGPPYAGRVVRLFDSSLKIRSKTIDFLFFIWSRAPDAHDLVTLAKATGCTEVFHELTS
jgi:hypothetical protein